MNEEPNHNISHLDRSYKNVQDFMRFMDAKAGVVFTLAGVIVGALAIKPGELDSWALFFAVIGSILAIAAMLYALRVVWPSHGPCDPKQLTLLFPALNPQAVNDDGSIPNLKILIAEKATQSLNEKFIISEFAAQLSHLHNPIVRKIRSLRRSITCMSCALVCVGISQVGRMTVESCMSNQTKTTEQEVSQPESIKPDSEKSPTLSDAQKLAPASGSQLNSEGQH